MCYQQQWSYQIVPEGSYIIRKNCPGCREKTNYVNTNRFRVNANGNKVDVWLIYHCSICKHTRNLTIYERKTASQITQQEYEKLMKNDRQLAERYGRDKGLFQKNKLEIQCDSLNFRLEMTVGQGRPGRAAVITINNPWQLTLRIDKIVAELLGVTRQREKALVSNGFIQFTKIDAQEFSVVVQLPADGNNGKLLSSKNQQRGQ